jgi:hypothetical protein
MQLFGPGVLPPCGCSLLKQLQGVCLSLVQDRTQSLAFFLLLYGYWKKRVSIYSADTTNKEGI